MSKRLRVTSRVSKKGRSLRPRSFPPRSPTSSAPALGQLDFDSTAPEAESFPPPEAEEDSEWDVPASDDATPAPTQAATESPVANDEQEPEAPAEAPEPAQAGPSESAHAGLSQDESAAVIEPAPTSTDAFSGEFFRKETDSVPPSVDASRAEAEDAGAPRPLSPQAIAYQARLRKIVAAVLAGVGLLALAVAGKALLTPQRASAPPARTPAALEIAPPQQAAEPPQPAAPPQPAMPPASAAAPEPAPPPEPSSSAGVATSAAATEPKAEEAPAADIVALKKETESLMNRGKWKDAIEKAKLAVAADPADALPYLYLGSSLQETGKWKEGIEAYSECVRHATKGPIHECRAMGGKK